MKILRAYKTELDPTQKQVESLLQHAGNARWAYNWGLSRKNEAWATRKAALAAGVPKADAPKVPTAIDLHRELNALKKLPADQGGIPWMYEASKCAPQEALRNLDAAFKGFFRRCRSGAKRKGFPRFKSRKRGIGSFRLTGAIHPAENSIQLPSLGSIRVKEHGYLPVRGVSILSATISEKVGRWYVSLQVRQEMPEPEPKPEHVIGIDVGVKSLANTSDGEVFENPKALSKVKKSLRVRQKAISRKVKGSSNRKKAVARVSRLHQRVANIRRDAIHKMTTAITKSASILVIEDLNVSGLLRNHRLALSLSDASLAEMHRQIEYKAVWYGASVRKVDKFYPSSKRCCRCGSVKTLLGLGERVYRCENAACGSVMDRDLNAAINLKLAGSSPASACCPGSAGRGRKTATKLLVGQEPSR